MGFTRRKYEWQRAEGIARNFPVYPPWNNIRGYAKDNLRPLGLSFTDTEAIATLQSVADWQLGGLLGLKSSASINDRMSVLHNDGWTFEFLIKYGSDGFSDNSEYKDVEEGSQKSVFATVGVTVRLMAQKQSGDVVLTEELWRNDSVNSWHAVFPIRYSFSKENTSMYYRCNFNHF